MSGDSAFRPWQVGNHNQQHNHFYSAAPDSDRARRLAAYLKAAERAAREHPYAGVLPGIAPPLTTVHLRRQVQRRGQGEASVADPASGALQAGRSASPAQAPETAAADTVLDSEPVCLLVSGPGSGKSSLLRAHVAACAQRLSAGEAVAALPVLVAASALTDAPLLEAVAQAATAQLRRFALLEALPVVFFRDDPLPGVPWQLLIDGFDEIVDPAARRAVLGMLGEVVASGHGKRYRVAVASRPLADDELSLLGENVPRYELLSLRPLELTAFAARWLRALGQPEPDAAARSFRGAVDGAGMTELARTPLAAAMLCQLYAVQPDRALPAGRTELYERFLTALHERAETERPTGPSLKLARHGPEVMARAHQLAAALPTLLARLAADRHSGDDRPVVDIVLGYPEAARPPSVPAKAWRSHVSELLRGTGLLVTVGDSLAFTHWTVLEYLAARHLTQDRQAARRAHRALFRDGWSWSGPLAKLGSDFAIYMGSEGTAEHGDPEVPLWGQVWKPGPDGSYAGFAIDALRETRWAARTDRALMRIARSGRLAGVRYLAGLAAAGTILRPEVTAAAAETALQREALPGARHGPVHIAETLFALGDPRGEERLLSTTGPSRRYAAEALAQHGHPAAASIFLSVATDPTAPSYDRLNTAHALDEVPDARGTEALAVIAAAPEVGTSVRLHATSALVERGDQRGQALLQALLDDWPESLRHSLRKAVELLAALAPDRVPDTLRRLALRPARGDRSAPGALDAARLLLQRGDPCARQAAHVALADPALRDMDRFHWLVLLTDAGEAAGPDGLAALADTSVSVRQQVATVLTACGDPRGLEAYASLAEDHAVPAHARYEAAHALTAAGDSRGLAIYLQMAADPEIGWVVGDESLDLLLRQHGTRAHPVLRALADNTVLSRHRRRHFANRLQAAARPDDPAHALARKRPFLRRRRLGSRNTDPSG